MSKLTASLAALTTTALLALAPTPAHAGPTSPAPCTSAEVSQAEWSQLVPGQSLAQVQSIIGSAGVLESTVGIRQVYRWTYCQDGHRLPQRLTFLAPNRLSPVPVLLVVHLPGL